MLALPQATLFLDELHKLDELLTRRNSDRQDNVDRLLTCRK